MTEEDSTHLHQRSEMTCCRCSRKGTCSGCICAQAGKSCRDCLPSKLGTCRNRCQNTDDLGEQRDQDKETSKEIDSIPECNFKWGRRDGPEAFKILSSAYREIVHWRPNVFQVPSGNTGKAFVTEIARLYQSFADKSSLESISIKASIVCQALLLQKPSRGSETKDHIRHLQRRLDLWNQGDFQVLIEEGRCIQQRLNQYKYESNPDHTARVFSRLMLLGKVKEAINFIFITRTANSKLLKLDDPIQITTPNGEETTITTKEVLILKHPQGKEADPHTLLDPNTTMNASIVNPIIFESLDSTAIKKAASFIKGSAGPSGIDAQLWRRMCLSFKPASNNLCTALAAVGRRICTEHIDPVGLEAFVVSRLVPLDKCPGIRPIGIGEVGRRIISKAVIRIFRDDIKSVTSPLQLCAGTISGCEAAIHAIRDLYNNETTEAILLVDATNAFNTLNRRAALLNIRTLCPPIARFLENTYQSPIKMFIRGSGEILFTEGVTQGDPMGMAFYAIAIMPLVQKIHEMDNGAKQVWFADDSSAAGTCNSLRTWWDGLNTLGPKFGYTPNAIKIHLLVKEEFENEARSAFMNTNVNITTKGKSYLGSPIGTEEFVAEFMMRKVDEWCQEVDNLSTIANSYPHEAYAVYTHGFSNKWTYVMRTTPNISDLLQPLEKIIHNHLVPAITGRPPCSAMERQLIALPPKMGGLGLPQSTEECNYTYEASRTITSPLVSLIKSQTIEGCITDESLMSLKSQIKKKTTERRVQREEEIRSQLGAKQLKLLNLSQEKGASNWLSVLPITKHGFDLHKGAFRDALCLRYGWRLLNTPQTCICGSNFSVDHAMICPKGGFPTIRHNEVRDLTANMLSEVCHNVTKEPLLQPVQGEIFHHQSANREEHARLDISARGFWNRSQVAFFDIRVFLPKRTFQSIHNNLSGL